MEKSILYFLMFLFGLTSSSWAQDKDLKLDHIVTKKRRIIFGTDYDYPPYEFLDKKGEPAGFNVDLIRAIGQETGHEVEVHLDVWTKIRPSLEDSLGYINVADMIYSGERAENVRFLPYHDVVSYVIVWNRDAPVVESLDALGDSILVVTNQAITQEYVSNLDSTIQIATAFTDYHALQMIATQKYNYALVHQYTAHEFVKKHPEVNLVVSENIIFFEKLSFVVKKHDKEMEQILKRGLHKIKQNGTYSELYVKWFGEKETLYKQTLKYIAWGLAVILCIGIFVGTWVYLLRMQVSRKTRKIRAIAHEQQEMRDLLARKNKELEGRNYELDKIVYSVSHNVRAPITSAMGIVNLMRIEYPDNQEMQFYANSIGVSLQKLDYYVNKILAYAANKNAAVESYPIDFTDLIGEAIREVSFLEGADKITFMKRIKQEVKFYSDPERLLTVMECLLANAVQYRKENNEQPSTIRLEVKITKDLAEIILIDNGEGIQAKQLDKIFEMFYRGNVRSKQAGLGLYVVKQIVHKLSGSVHIESAHKKGTTVRLYVPNGKVPEIKA